MNRDNNSRTNRRHHPFNNRSRVQPAPSDSSISKTAQASTRTWPSIPGSYGQYNNISRTQPPSVWYSEGYARETQPYGGYGSNRIPPTHPWPAYGIQPVGQQYTTWTTSYGNQQYNPGRTGNYGTERSHTGYGSRTQRYNSGQGPRIQPSIDDTATVPSTTPILEPKTDAEPAKCGAQPPGALPPFPETPKIEAAGVPSQTEQSSSGYASRTQSSAEESPPSTSAAQSPASKIPEPLPLPNASGIRSGRPPEITKIDLDDDDDVCVVETAGVTAAVKTEDAKPAMACIDLLEDCPEEVLNRFHYEARTKILQQLCATFDETGFLEALKQLKLLLEKQRAEIKMKCDLMQLLTRFLLFLGSNYSSIGTVFVEEYLELMEDVIVHYCEVVREYMIVQLERKKRRNLKRLGTRIKFVMAQCLLYRMDSIMHCLFKVQLYPGEQEHCFLWTDVFIYFLKKVKYELKDDDVVRAYIGWQKMKTIRSVADADLIDDVMYMRLGKNVDEMRKIPCLKEIIDAKRADSRYDVRDMLTRYWKWWREERPRELWTDLEEPTVMELPGRPDLELGACAEFKTSSTKMVDEVARLIEDRRSGRNPGLIQQATQKRDPETTSVFSPSIFDDDDISLCVEDSDDDDLIIQEVESITKRAEEVVVFLSDSDADEDEDDIVIVEPEEPVTAAPLSAATELEKTATEPDLDLSPKENTDKVFSANDEPMVEKTAAVSEQPNQDDSEIANDPHLDKSPEEPKETQETPLPETKGIFDDSDDDDEDNFEETVSDKPNNDNPDLTEETLSEALPNSNNWMDWDDEWAEMEDKPVPDLLEFMDRPETPDEDCDKVAAPSNTTERYSIFEKPAPFGSWCTEPFNFDGSDEETEAADTPRTVSEGNSSITIKHEQMSEECSESASVSSQKVDEDNLDTFTEKNSLVPEKEDTVVGEPEIDDEPRESEEIACVEENAEESKVEDQSLNDKTDDVPDETSSGIPQQPEESDVGVPATDVLDDKLPEAQPQVPESVAAEHAVKNIEETPVPSDKPIAKPDIEDDKCKETAEPVAEKSNIKEAPVDEEVEKAKSVPEKPPKAEEQATPSSSDTQINSEPEEDSSCVKQTPQKPEEPLSSKNVFCVRSLVMEIEKLPPAKLSNGETIVEEEEEDIGFCLSDININGFSDDDSDNNDDEAYRQSTIVEGMEVPQRDGLGWGISPISKVDVEAVESFKSEKLTEGVLQSNKDSNIQEGNNVSKPQNSSCSSDSSRPSCEMLDKIEVEQHFEAARKQLGMLSPNSKITDCSTSVSDVSSLSTILSDLSSTGSVEKPMNARDPRLSGQSDVAKRYKRSLDECASANRLLMNGWNDSVMDATVINCNESPTSKDDPVAQAHRLVDLYTNFAKEVSVEAQEDNAADVSMINLASPSNSDNVIMLQCRSILKEEDETASTAEAIVPPSDAQTVALLLTPDPAFDDQHFSKDKPSGYEILVPQEGYTDNIRPPLSGSQPCSPQTSPSATTNNGGVEENSTILYHPILKQYPGLNPAAVPKVVPPQDALKISNNNTEQHPPKAVNFVKVASPQKAKPAPVQQALSIFGSKFETKNPQEVQRKSRRKGGVESNSKPRRKDLQASKTNKSQKTPEEPKHITAEDESDLFQNALEGPTGKPLRNTGGNMFWDESEDAFKGSSISVKADSQLKSDAQLRRSILKTPTRRKVKFALSNEHEIKEYNNPAGLDPRFHEPAIIKIEYRDIIPKPVMQRYMEKRTEERKRLKMQQEAHKRALDRAQMMELNEQQQHRQDNNIVYYIFSDKWDKKDKHLIPKCSEISSRGETISGAHQATTAKQQTDLIDYAFGETDDHNHRNHRNGERPPEKRKRSEHTNETPAKKVRITVPTDLTEKKSRGAAPELERDRPNGVSHRKSKISAKPDATDKKSKNAAPEFTATKKHSENTSSIGKKAKTNSVPPSNGIDLIENGPTSSQTKSGRLRHKPSGKDYYDVTKRTTGRRKATHQF